MYACPIVRDRRHWDNITTHLHMSNGMNWLSNRWAIIAQVVTIKFYDGQTTSAYLSVFISLPDLCSVYVIHFVYKTVESTGKSTEHRWACDFEVLLTDNDALVDCIFGHLPRLKCGKPILIIFLLNYNFPMSSCIFKTGWGCWGPRFRLLIRRCSK